MQHSSYFASNLLTDIFEAYSSYAALQLRISIKNFLGWNQIICIDYKAQFRIDERLFSEPAGCYAVKLTLLLL